MEALYRNETARLVGGLPHDEYLVVSGRVQSLETVYQLIETLDQAEKQINEHKRPTGKPDTTRNDLAFAGSHWFDLSRMAGTSKRP